MTTSAQTRFDRPPRIPRSHMPARMRRERLDVRGRVQGVGFRPFVYRIATDLGLTGRVGNDSRGAFIEIQGMPAALLTFRDRLSREMPPLANIRELLRRDLEPRPESDFRIENSEIAGPREAQVTPDSCLCLDCLAEMNDPADRRYRYPFINCTNCGPRYSIVKTVPYDRPNTTMAAFTMCPMCQAEYDDPADRRFHAQPNACPTCGPRLWLTDADGHEIPGDAIAQCAQQLRQGGIVAIKGMGGFHLACRADDDDAVLRLRQRKTRETRPFGIMASTLDAARQWAQIDEHAAAILTDVSRPILLLPRIDACVIDGHISRHVAPCTDTLGIMLPYTPIHELLFAESLGPLVMTSGNPSAEPLCCDNDEALHRLAHIADAFLLHDRAIERRVDDSVLLAVGMGHPERSECHPERSEGSQPQPVSNGPGSAGGPGPLDLGSRLDSASRSNGVCHDSVSRAPGNAIIPIRRARGHTPEPLQLATATPEPILAVGAGLKSTICILDRNEATLSEHLGDLFNPAAYRNFTRTVDQFETLLKVAPQVIAHDLHPDYMATHYAKKRSSRTIAIQHHHAHVVSAMADNDLQGQVIGVACDGTGYGTDGAIWGCEILVADEADFTRAAHLAYFPLLGGDAAACETWRPAAGLLHETYGPNWLTKARTARLFTDPHAGSHGSPQCHPERSEGSQPHRVSKGANNAGGPGPLDLGSRFPNSEQHADVMLSAAKHLNAEQLAIAAQRLKNPHRLPLTSSLGRLFDAVAFLLGLCDYNHSEAQAAMTLEAAARQHELCPPWPYGVMITNNDDAPMQIDYRPMIRALLAALAEKQDVPRLARTFHETVIAMLSEAVRRVAAQTGLNRVVLSGGCFANRLLTEGLLHRLQADRLKVFIHHRVPTTDGGIALGQAVIAAEKLRRPQENQNLRDPERNRCHPERSQCHPEQSECHPERSEGSQSFSSGKASASGMTL